ncbi:MAG: putative extracellular nuclease [Thermoleophilia bacterium]|nr:putative extracellular nuclease [Thermoleophilia bacterium]
MRLMGATTSSVTSQPAVKPATAGDLRVAQMNCWNLFDTVNDPKTGDDSTTPTAEQYAIKLTKIANAITELGTPDVISLNEIENETVLKDLLAQPQLKDVGYKFLVQQSNDERGITVGMLYKGDKLDLVGHESFNPKMSFQDGGRGQVDRSLLYARPPMVVDFKARGAAQAGEGAGLLTVVVNHFKSKLGGDAPEARRQMQGQYLGEWLDARRATKPGNVSIVVGDLNANHGEGAYEKLAKRADGSKRLYDAPLNLKLEDRYSYIYRGQKDLLDHLLVTSGKEDAIKAVQILHVNSPKDAKKSQWDPKVLAGYSDHDSMIVDFDLAKLTGGAAS